MEHLFSSVFSFIFQPSAGCHGNASLPFHPSHSSNVLFLCWSPAAADPSPNPEPIRGDFSLKPPALTPQRDGDRNSSSHRGTAVTFKLRASKHHQWSFFLLRHTIRKTSVLALGFSWYANLSRWHYEIFFFLIGFHHELSQQTIRLQQTHRTGVDVLPLVGLSVDTSLRGANGGSPLYAQMLSVWAKAGQTLEVAAAKVLRKREVRRQVVSPSVALGFRTKLSFTANKMCWVRVTRLFLFTPPLATSLTVSNICLVTRQFCLIFAERCCSVVYPAGWFVPIVAIL